MTAFDGEDAGPVPPMFVAVTVNVYWTPFASPLTTIGLPVPVASRVPGTRSPCTSSTGPSGGVKLTVAWLVPAVAVTPVGAAGAVVMKAQAAPTSVLSS